jgi:hypothetical protein
MNASAPVDRCLQSVGSVGIDGVADCAGGHIAAISPAFSAHRCAATGLDSSTVAERLPSVPSTAQWIARSGSRGGWDLAGISRASCCA